MTDNNIHSAGTREIAVKWFGAISKGDAATARSLLDDNVLWINYTPVKGFNDIMPWIGTYHGPDAVIKSFALFLSICEVQSEELVSLIVEGNTAVGVIKERSKVKATGSLFEIEFIQLLTVENGKITRWKSYTDPSPIIAAMRG